MILGGPRSTCSARACSRWRMTGATNPKRVGGRGTARPARAGRRPGQRPRCSASSSPRCFPRSRSGSDGRPTRSPSRAPPRSAGVAESGSCGSSLRDRYARGRSRIAAAWSAQRVRSAGPAACPRRCGSERRPGPARRSRRRQDRAAGVPAGPRVGVPHRASGGCRVRDGARVRGLAPAVRAHARRPRRGCPARNRMRCGSPSACRTGPPRITSSSRWRC